MRTRIVGALLASAGTLLVAGPSAWAGVTPVARAAAVCADYDTQAEAQRAADTIDADGDGIYCETLPCPCLRPGEGGGGAGGGGGSEPAPRRKPKPRAQRIQARITAVTDGDTIRVRAYGAKRRFYRVRLIGIDTPETVDPSSPLECGGLEATSNMLRLAFTFPVDSDGDGILDAKGGEGRRVTLVTDPTQHLFDSFGRLLAYVTRSGTDLGARQLRAGWAKVYVFEKRFRRYARFRKALRQARSSDRGVWGICDGRFHRPADPETPYTLPEPPPAPVTPAPTPTPTPTPSCNPNYSGACLPLGADVDCSEISARNFSVVGTDVFRLDADGDGIACES